MNMSTVLCFVFSAFQDAILYLSFVCALTNTCNSFSILSSPTWTWNRKCKGGRNCGGLEVDARRVQLVAIDLLHWVSEFSFSLVLCPCLPVPTWMLLYP